MSASWARRSAWVAGGGGALLVALLAIVWMFRLPLAGLALGAWCDGRDLDCRISLNRLDFGRVEASQLVVATSSGAPFEANAIAVDLSWPSLFAPSIDRVRLDQPTVRAEFRDGGLGFYGLDDLLQGASDGPSEGASGPIPALEIVAGRFFIDTDAGILRGEAELEGAFPEDGRVRIELTPAELHRGDFRVRWSDGRVELDLEDGSASGRLGVTVEDLALPGVSLSDFVLSGDVTDGAGPIQASWRGRAAAARYGDYSAEDIAGFGEAAMAGLDPSAAGWLSLFEGGVLDLRAAAAAFPGGRLSALQVRADIARDGDAIGGPIVFDAANITTPYGGVGVGSLAADVAVTAMEEARARLSVLIEDATISSEGLAPLLSVVDAPNPFVGHAAARRSALARAAGSFMTGVDAEVVVDAAADWRLSATRPLLIEAASGLTVSVEPPSGQPWLRLDPRRVALSGAFSMKGGGGPDLAFVLDRLELGDDVIDVAARGVELKPWRAGGASVSMSMSEAGFFRDPAAARAFSVGEIGFDGMVSGIEVRGTRLFGGVEAASGAGGWRVQTRSADCLGFMTEGLAYGVNRLEPVRLAVCPEQGRFIQERNGAPGGRLRLGDVDLPFSAAETTGRLSLADGVLDWRAGNGLTAGFDASRLELPIVTGGRDAVLVSERPMLRLSASGGPIDVSADFSDLSLGGALVPADVAASALILRGRLDDDGLTATAETEGLEISDLNDDPLYEPILADLSGELSDGRVRLFGPLKLANSGTLVAQATLDVDLSALDGTARLATERLSFSPGGLQPTDLSDQVRGVLNDARGALTASANFAIRRGEVSGEATVIVEDLGFSTFRLGTVEGVNGEIAVTDVIGLKTGPGQTVSIDEIDLGVPLQDGIIRFQLLGPDEAQLESARWPFAGGELRVAPARWTLFGDRERLTIRASDIELSQLIEIFEIPDLEADAQLSGVFPVDIVGPVIYVRDARLAAAEAGGVMRYTGAAADQAADVAAQQNPYAAASLRALKDFEFTVMEIGADGSLTGEMAITARLVGRNADVLDGQVFAFNVRLDSELAALLQSGQRALGSDWLVDAVAAQTEEGRARDE